MADVPHIEEREDGWHLIDGETDSAFGTRQDAFDAMRETAWFQAALERKPQIDGLAEPRWFDAATIEDLPASDGSQVSAKSIDDMVRNLAEEGVPIPFDGAGVSGVHEYAVNPGADAAGYGYVGIKAIDINGQPHLWLYGAALPEVDEAIDAKRIQFGSILFYDDQKHRYTQEPIGTVLGSYALTNRPYQEGLTPHAARSKDGPARTAHRTRSRRIETMTAKTNPTGHERGPAKDALAEIAGLLKVELPEELNEDAIWSITDKVRALANAASVEDITEGGEAPAPGDESGAEGRSGEPTGEPSQRALLEGFESEEAQDAFTQDVRMALGDIFGQPEATPAELLDLLKSSQEAFKGALGNAEPSGDGTDSEGDAARSRAQEANLRALETRISKLESENEALNSEKLDREIGDAIVAESEAAGKLAPAGEELASLRSLVRETADAKLDWRRFAKTLCAGRAAPPAGTATDPKPGEGTRSSGTATTADEAIAAHLERLTAEAKEKGERIKSGALRGMAYRAAKAESPHLFRPTQGDG